MLRPAIWSVHMLSLLSSPILRIILGSEVDLDLGNYERYLGLTLTGDNNITTGKIYQHVCSLMCAPMDNVLTALRSSKRNAAAITSGRPSKCAYLPMATVHA